MKIKTFIAALLSATLLVGVMPSAVANKEGPKRPSISEMAEQLAMDANQVAQLQALEAQMLLDRDAIKNKYTLAERKQAREEMKTLRDSFRLQLAEILTEEQLDELKALRKDKRKMRDS